MNSTFLTQQALTILTAPFRPHEDREIALQTLEEAGATREALLHLAGLYRRQASRLGISYAEDLLETRTRLKNTVCFTAETIFWIAIGCGALWLLRLYSLTFAEPLFARFHSETDPEMVRAVILLGALFFFPAAASMLRGPHSLRKDQTLFKILAWIQCGLIIAALLIAGLAIAFPLR